MGWDNSQVIKIRDNFMERRIDGTLITGKINETLVKHSTLNRDERNAVYNIFGQPL